MSTPRDHHFIPAFFLKQWAGPDGKLTEFTRQRGKLLVKRVGPRATGFETYLYAFPELPAETAQHLEVAFFGYADELAAKALDLHLNPTGRPWSSELVSAWSRFVVGIHLRHPDVMLELRRAARATWEQSGAEQQGAYEKIRKASDPSAFDEYLGEKDPLTGHKMQLNLIIKALNNHVVCSHINQMRFAIIDVAPSPHRFLMSDRPVEIFALGTPRGVVSIPISPTKLFVAVDDDATFRTFVGNSMSTIVASVNEYVVLRARRFVWATDGSHAVYVERMMSTKMESLPLFPALAHHSPIREP